MTEGNACGAIPWIEGSTNETARKIEGIATPVCGLVRNDVFYMDVRGRNTFFPDTHTFLLTISNLSDMILAN